MNLQARFHPSTISNFLKIKREFPSAIIAGGAVRDLCLGKEIKDIDVFISGDPKSRIVHAAKKRSHWIHNFRAFWQKVLQDRNWNIKVNTSSYNKDPAIDMVFSMYNPDLDFTMIDTVPKIDVIFLVKPALQYFEEDFDFNICKAYFDGTKSKYTSGFVKDARNETITLAGPLDFRSINYSMNLHLPRIKHKYPNFKEVIPQKYKDILYNDIPF
jgi:hypothetical protein